MKKRRCGIIEKNEQKAEVRVRTTWQCTCCLKWNRGHYTSCVVCGREELYGGSKCDLKTKLAIQSLRGSQIELNDQAGPGGVINEPDAKGWTSLHVASAAGNAGLLRVLLEQGGFVEAVTNCGYRPLHIAAAHCADCVKILLEAEANALASTRVLQQTPLHLCTSTEAAHALIKRGKQIIQARDINGLTPLHTAALHGRTQVVREILLFADLDLIITLDHEHFSARHLAELRQHTDVINLLKRAEALARGQLLNEGHQVRPLDELQACAFHLERNKEEAQIATQKQFQLANERIQVKSPAFAKRQRWLENSQLLPSGLPLLDTFLQYQNYAHHPQKEHQKQFRLPPPSSVYARLPPPLINT